MRRGRERGAFAAEELQFGVFNGACGLLANVATSCPRPAGRRLTLAVDHFARALAQAYFAR